MAFGKHDRTKIIATLGPASDKPATIRAMMRAGMDMARLNFSHGTPAHHRLLTSRTRAAAKALRVPVQIIGDLQGPRVRISKLKAPLLVGRGKIMVITAVARGFIPRKASGGQVPTLRIPVDDPTLYRDLKPSDRIEIANGTIELRVTKIVGHDIRAKVIRGGTITSGRGIATPGRSLSLPAITSKDREGIVLGVRLGVDYLNVSFVKTAADIVLARRLVTKAGGRKTKLMAKIETAEAVKNIQSILEVADAIMIGRGDLAFAFPMEKLPIIQKDLIRAAHRADKPVVVATEMLASMVTSRAPTRAEVSDVANAVIDHASATMLSEETAIGRYPALAVRTMARIIHETEKSRYD